jgi:hypothetical protein
MSQNTRIQREALLGTDSKTEITAFALIRKLGPGFTLIFKCFWCNTHVFLRFMFDVVPLRLPRRYAPRNDFLIIADCCLLIVYASLANFSPN